MIPHTRLLSEYQLTVAGRRPSLLSAAVSRDNVILPLTFNRPSATGTGRRFSGHHPHIGVERNRLLEERMFERICLFQRYGAEQPVQLTG